MFFFTNFEIMPPKSKVCFFFQEVKANLTNRSILKKYIESIFRKEGQKLDSVNFIFCSDKALLKINQTYLKHDFYTDIITFNLSDNESIRAEIYISIDRVRENSFALGVPYKAELLRVIFHGVLHLCGYNDKTKTEKKKIRKREDLFINKYQSRSL